MTIASAPDIVPRETRYREEVVRFLRELADRVESGDLQDATSVHAVLDRSREGAGWALVGSAHLDTVQVIGRLEWIKATLLERLLGRGEE
jgi:hypothetical protein